MKTKMTSMLAIVMMLVIPTLQAHAETLSVQSAIESLNFSLTTWDQKDQSVRIAATKKFVNDLATLEKQGVSKDEIIAAIKAQMPDAQTAKDVDTLMNIAKQQKLSAVESNQLVMNYLAKAQTSGASWSGDATLAVVTGAVVIAVVLVLAAGGSVSVSSGRYYNDPYYYYQTCDYDYYGNYYCW
jgi:hypothetical protein